MSNVFFTICTKVYCTMIFSVFAIILGAWGASCQIVTSPLRSPTGTQFAANSLVTLTVGFSGAAGFDIRWKINTTQVASCTYVSPNFFSCPKSASVYNSRLSCQSEIIGGDPLSTCSLTVYLTDGDLFFTIETLSDVILNSTTIAVKACTNSSLEGVANDVPANSVYQSTHTFACLNDYSGSSFNATCQANATWSLPSSSFCTAACNTSNIPDNSTYKLPSIHEKLVVNSAIKLNCTDGRNGSALATCVNVSTWNVENNCSAVCYLNASYCNPSGARSVLEGVHSLICCNDRSSVEANCNSSGSISYSNSCISVSTTQSINVATSESSSTQTTEVTTTGSSTVSSVTSTVSSQASTVGSMPEKDTTVPATTTSTASTAATTVASPTTTSGTPGGLKWWEILLIVIFAGICPLFAVLVILWLIYDKKENRTGKGLLTFYFECRYYERIPWCSPCSWCKRN